MITVPCPHCNGECCYLEKREGTTRYAVRLPHDQGIHTCKRCKDGTVERYQIESEIEIEKGCRCCSCWEKTGRWIVSDVKDEMEDLVFDSEEQAEEWVKQNEQGCLSTLQSS